jgi:type IX secretion system PorP/SprF family membrane protein
MKKFYSLLIIVVLIGSDLFAQEFNFTQYGVNPLYLNPANTGVMNRDVRAGVTYRDQGRSVSKSYSSAAANIDVALYPKGKGTDFWGFGLLATRHTQGFFDFNTVSVNVSGSYTKSLNADGSSFLSFGFMGGYAQQSRTDAVNQLTWDNQWSTTKYKFDGSLPTNEDDLTFNGRRNFNYSDFGAGVLYNGIVNPNLQVNAGLALSHLNSPNISFSNSSEAKKNPKLALHGTAEIASGFDSKIRLVPTFLYLRQGPQQMLNTGVFVKFILGANSKYTEYRKESSFSGGLQYRVKDAISPMVKYEVNSYTIAASYDITTSTLRNINNSVGAFEITLIYNGKTNFGSKGKSRKLRFL